MRRLAMSLSVVVLAAFASMGAASARQADSHDPALIRSLPPPTPCNGCWHPPLVTRWQYQLQGVQAFASTGGINVAITEVPYGGGQPVAPDAFDIDLYVDQKISGNDHTVDTAAVTAIHAAGHRAVCYVDAGTWENWRPDAKQFPKKVRGKSNGWPGEKWLDIRQTQILLPLMEARVTKCAQGGFDALEFDNVDGAFNDTGFPLSKDDQLAFNARIANLAHAHGLSVGLKNDVDANQISTLLPYFDFAVNEQCFQYKECAALEPFVGAGKPVFNVEYKGPVSKFCPAMNGTYDFNSAFKKKSLYDEPWTPCR